MASITPETLTQTLTLGPLPGSRKAYVEQKGLKVAMREVMLSDKSA